MEAKRDRWAFLATGPPAARDALIERAAAQAAAEEEAYTAAGGPDLIIGTTVVA
jgi:hypothetical protein